MTPKEKAKELVERYYRLFSIELENTIDYREAKKCALIAVDEILDIILFFYEYDVDMLAIYWQEVKQEIKDL